MTGARVARMAAVLFVSLICISCGDTYRPVAVPITPPPPDPSGFHFVLSLSDNGAACGEFCDPGGTTRIDVSGDTNVGVARVGLGPVHAALLPNASRLYVANRLEDTISTYAPTNPSSVTTVSLPAGSVPVFVHTAENGTVYVANFGTNRVAAISTISNVVTDFIAVGLNPSAMAETPDAKKLYVVNGGDGTVTSINTADKKVNPIIALGGNLVWAAARADSQRVFVLDQSSGNVYVIDATTTPETVLGSVPTAAGADFMTYDSKLNRLYVTSSSGDALWAFDVSPTSPPGLPILLAGPVPITEWVAPPPLQNPCAGAPVVPVSAAALPDRSLVYIASYQLMGGVICSQLTALDSGTFVTRVTISVDPVQNDPNSGVPTVVPATVDTSNPTGCQTARPATPPGAPPAGFRVSVVASADSTRVYVAKCDAGSTAIVRTADDVHVLDVPAPVSGFPPPPPPNPGDPQPQPPRQNPVFALSGP